MDLKQILTPSNSILVVWDVQNGLVRGTFNKDQFVKALERTIGAARRAKIPVVYTKITPFPSGFEPYASRVTSRQFRFTSEDLELYEKPAEGEIILPKNTWSIFVGTNFELLLRNSGRNAIIFTGIATEIGVETSARHAFALGFMPVIVSDAVSSFNKEGHERSLANMKDFFPVITSEELEKILG
ncbi:isochorismatase family cysteine hydrolase [Metallosphaera javensis (ex Sakai et al. 2022)]|uniref:isochorismatase family cysteine hydrolase n=1 Tax=Metallosphaera javensis (ex Sakai et al. 2022) TaxID=2775498 RepID=UPI0025830D4D|nr:MAG: putative isochorismatase family protein [Metallosphaera javensis (ex Sakai et al. 2022)]